MDRLRPLSPWPLVKTKTQVFQGFSYLSLDPSDWSHLTCYVSFFLRFNLDLLKLFIWICSHFEICLVMKIFSMRLSNRSLFLSTKKKL